MFTKRAKWVLLIGSILGILICLFGCATLTATNTGYTKKYPYEKSPIRVLSIHIEENQREELFTQLRKFSEKHRFSFDLSFYRDKEIFFIEMHGNGLEISPLSNPTPHTTELDIPFFEDDPTNPPSQETVDELYNDLKAFISEIPNVKIIEEK